ncbi:MAG: hypothetical protein AAF242_17530, partial [Bacteroidota bacterium]
MTPDDFNRETNGLSKKEIDSLNLLQRKVDDYNTQKLIKLTHKYGWISNERLHCPDLHVWIIFRHS